MVKRFLFLTLLMGVPLVAHSQTGVYSSSAESAKNGKTFSHVVGGVANVESEDGMLSVGPYVGYTVTTLTGFVLVDVSLLSVYPNAIMA